MEQAVMPVGTTKYNHRHGTNPFIKHIGLHTSGQDIDHFYFPKYRPPYIWTRNQFSLLLQNIGLHTSGQDMTYSS